VFAQPVLFALKTKERAATSFSRTNPLTVFFLSLLSLPQIRETATAHGRTTNAMLGETTETVDVLLPRLPETETTAVVEIVPGTVARPHRRLPETVFETGSVTDEEIRPAFANVNVIETVTEIAVDDRLLLDAGGHP
jgi:hypothetical protein